MTNNRDIRINEININKYGTKMKIIEYYKYSDIIVEFQDNYHYITHAQYGEFKRGEIANPYDKSVCGVGYLGVGIWKSKVKNKTTDVYQHWTNMIKRCYNQKNLKKDYTYQGCTVCEDWLNFQNFASWYNKNYYEVINEIMDLDKDILNKGNKVYSPNNCILVPHTINSLFVKCNKSRGVCPIGVSFHKRDLIYQASCNDLLNNKYIFLGYYDDKHDAFNAYKVYKENLIKNVADKYKNQIPKQLYDAMYSYVVEITD